MVLENGRFVSAPAPSSATVILGDGALMKSGGQTSVISGRRSPVPPGSLRSLSPLPPPQPSPLQGAVASVFGASPSAAPSSATVVYVAAPAAPAAAGGAAVPSGAFAGGSGSALLPPQSDSSLGSGGRRRWGPTVGKLCFVPVGTVNLLGSGTVCSQKPSACCDVVVFLFCSVLFCSVLFCSVLFCSVLFCEWGASVAHTGCI